MQQPPKALMIALLALPGGFVITPALWLLQRHLSRRPKPPVAEHVPA